MNKMVWSIIAGILLLSACQNSEPKTKVNTPSENPQQQQVEMQKDTSFPYPNLLPDKAQTYSLLAIGEQEDKTPIEDDPKIMKTVTNILSLPTLEMVEKIYPKLPIENKSAFILFDNNGVVHQSKTLTELTSFLENNPLN